MFRAVLFSMLLALAVPALAPAQEGAISASEGTSAATEATTDAAIATRIRDILHELDGYDDVTVTVKAGVVTLRGTALDAALVDGLDALVGRVEGVVAIENEVRLSTSVTDRLAPVIDRLVARLDQAVSFLPLIGVALLAFAAVTWAGFLVARRRQPWERLAPNAFIAEIYRTVLKLASVLAGLVVALDILGATALLSTILGAAGIFGLAIGFAVRDTVENFIASILLSIRQPFRPNDAIEINGDEGKVIRLTSRATILLNWDGNHVRIPNATVFKSRILNYTRNPERRFTFSLAVAPGTDLAAARALAEETVRALPFTLETPAVTSWLTEPGPSAVAMTIAGWINQRETGLNAARSEAIRQVLIAFSEAGIELPEPGYRVRMDAQPEPPAPPRREAAVAPTPATGEADVSAATEAELDRLVNDERRETAENDLLAEGARNE